MSREDLLHYIDTLREDFARVNGQPFKHFFCPILHVDEPCGVDEPGEVIKGHVTPEALGGKIWVPQRADVDNFYGCATEADFSGIVLDRPKGAFNTLIDPTASRRQRPRIETATGVHVPHYPMKSMSKLPVGHSFVKIVQEDGREILFGLKSPVDDILAPNDREGDIYVVIEQDYRAAAAASAIKAAHLTCFKLFGYEYVFSYAGKSVSPILRDFYLKARNSERKKIELIEHFKKHYTMVLPLSGFEGEAPLFQGTLIDGQVLHCLDTRGRVFALGIIIKAGSNLIVVFLPGESGAIDTYFNFLTYPSESVQARVGPLFPLGGDPNVTIGVKIGGRDV